MEKFLLLLFISISSSISFASNEVKEEMIYSILEAQGISQQIDKSMETYRAEIDRVYKHIDKEKLEQYLENYRAMQFAIYFDAFAHLSNAELADLLKYYRSEDGKRYLSIHRKYSEYYQERLKYFQSDMNDKFLKLLNE
jgi:hypothetical protein